MAAIPEAVLDNISTCTFVCDVAICSYGRGRHGCLALTELNRQFYATPWVASLHERSSLARMRWHISLRFRGVDPDMLAAMFEGLHTLRVHATRWGYLRVDGGTLGVALQEAILLGVRAADDGIEFHVTGW